MSKISFYILDLLEAKIHADILGDSEPHKSKEGISSPKAKFVICECPSFVWFCYGFLTYQVCSRRGI